MSPSNTPDSTSTSLRQLLVPTKLRGHALLMLGGAVAVAAIAANFLVGPWAARASEEALGARARSLAQRLERHRDLRMAMKMGDVRVVSELTSALLEDRELRYVAVLDKHDAVLGGATAVEGQTPEAAAKAHQDGSSA